MDTAPDPFLVSCGKKKPVNCTRILPYSLEKMQFVFKRTVLKVGTLGDCNGNVNVLVSDLQTQSSSGMWT